MTVMTMTPEVTQGGRHRAPQTGPMRGNPWWTLAAVSIGVIMVGLDASVVAIANPRIAVALHASLADLQWITDAYLLALASLLIFGGKLGDRFGRREMFVIGVAPALLTLWIRRSIPESSMWENGSATPADKFRS